MHSKKPMGLLYLRIENPFVRKYVFHQMKFLNENFTRIQVHYNEPKASPYVINQSILNLEMFWNFKFRIFNYLIFKILICSVLYFNITLIFLKYIFSRHFTCHLK
jgi:hypothetical protein